MPGTLARPRINRKLCGARAQRVRFDLELKRVPFYPEVIGDGFTGKAPGLLESRVVEIVKEFGVVDRTIVRSFDHRSVWWVRQLRGSARPRFSLRKRRRFDIVELCRKTNAAIYCPDYRFLDRAQVRQAHGAGIRVVPWTVNDPKALHRLLDWEVDGVTTDFPDVMAEVLKERGLSF